MNDELDREKELSERFSSHTKAAKETNNAGDAENADETSDPKSTRDTSGTDDANYTNDTTRNRQQYVMYLPPDLHQALNERFNRYDGVAKITDGDGIEKHKDFNEAIVRAGLDNERLDEYVGVSSTLDK